MAEINIEGISIEHNGDVDRGLDYLRDRWNDSYVMKVFQDARATGDGVLKIENIDGYYVLRHLGGDRFSLTWRRS